MNKIIGTIKKFLNENIKSLLFLVIFSLVIVIYNQNIQAINYILKKGTVLEYSINYNQKLDKNLLKDKLSQLNINYSFVDTMDAKDLKYPYDTDLKPVEKLLSVAVPIVANEKHQDLINNISDYIFENYPNSKLIDIKSYNDYYSKPFNLLIKFFFVLSVSFIIWFILLCIFFDSKKMLQKTWQDFLLLLDDKKNELKNFIENTKKRGVGYFFRKLLLDDTKDDENEDNLFKEIITTIFFVIICVILIRYFIGELRWIPSGSMRPTILEHDRVFVEKLRYPTKQIERGDILVFYPPDSELSNNPFAIFARLSGIFCKDIAFIKRVIGLPGEKLEIKQDKLTNQFHVYINDKALKEPYIISKSNWTPCSNGMYCGPFIIPKDSYFMMGDNRGNSQDSRFWGFLNKSRVIGRANFMFFPFSRINLLRDKYLDLNEQKLFNQYSKRRFLLNRYEFLYRI